MSDEKIIKLPRPDRTDEVLRAVEGLRQQQSMQHDEQLFIAKESKGILLWLKDWATRMYRK